MVEPSIDKLSMSLMKWFIIVYLLMIMGCSKKPTLYHGQPEGEWINRAQAGDLPTRIDGVQALGHYRDEQSISVLKHLTQDGNVGIRYYATDSLWQDTHSVALVI